MLKKLLILAGEIIEYEKGQTIKFFYEKNLDQELNKLHLFRLDIINRYYLLASTLDEDSCLPTGF